MSQAASAPKGLALTNEEIDKAFHENQFSLVFQPQIWTAGGDVFGAEAFCRWQHEVYGAIPPSLFVSFIESQGRSRELTNHTLRSAALAGAKWQAANLNWTVGVNVNISDLADGTLPQSIDILSRELGLDRESLAIDVPESELALQWDRKHENVAATLATLKSKGVKLCLDGTGPQTLDDDKIDPGLFDVIKLGGRANLNFLNETGNLSFGHIARRLDFAKKHSLLTSAVGAETHAALLALKKFGFDLVQGHIIAKPAPLEEISDWRRNYMAPSAYLATGVTSQNAAPKREEVIAEKTSSNELDGEWAEVSSSAHDGDETVLTRKS